jgi:phasin
MKTPFDVPPEMKAFADQSKAFAEQSIETARKAFHSYLDATQKAFGAMGNSAGSAQVTATDLGRTAMTYAQENVSATFAFIDRVMKAKDPQEVLQLQTDFVQSQMMKLGEQTKSIGEAAAKYAMDAARPKM